MKITNGSLIRCVTLDTANGKLKLNNSYILGVEEIPEAVYDMSDDGFALLVSKNDEKPLLFRFNRDGRQVKSSELRMPKCTGEKIIWNIFGSNSEVCGSIGCEYRHKNERDVKVNFVNRFNLVTTCFNLHGD